VGNQVYYNQGLTGFLARAFVPKEIAQIINGGVLAGLLFLSFKKTQSTKESAEVEMMEQGLFLISILVGGGLAWSHHFVLMIIPFAGMYWYLKKTIKTKSKMLNRGLFLAFILVGMNLKNVIVSMNGWLNLGLSHRLYGAVLLYWLMINGLRRDRLNNRFQD
jgi:hypothetical protein